MNKNFKKLVACLVATASLVTGMVGISASAASIDDSHDVLAWSESENAVTSNGYFEWVKTGTSTVLGYKNSSIIGKQLLDSYRYENLDDQKKAKAVVKNYTYDAGSNSYSYGWKNSTDCYCRARVETVSGYVYQDSERKFCKYTIPAETKELSIGICKTYCGNLAADD